MSRGKATRYYSEDVTRHLMLDALWLFYNRNVGEILSDDLPESFASLAGKLLGSTRRPVELSLRPEVAAFAQAMEEKLGQNDHKPHWRDQTVDYLISRLDEEVAELKQAVIDGEGVLYEAADVGNIANMIADVTGT